MWAELGDASRAIALFVIIDINIVGVCACLAHIPL